MLDEIPPLSETPLDYRGPRSDLKLVQLLPNMLTVAALCAGLSSIRFTIDGNYPLAATLILIAAVLDVCDGALARFLRTMSGIGAELDSLSDAISFGVAPAILVYMWIAQDVPQIGWIAALFYAACCVMRLARFNLGSRAPDAAATQGHFTGVPAPAGAILLMLPLYVAFVVPERAVLPPVLAVVWLGVVGLLMIGRFHTPSLKSARLFADHRLMAVILIAILVASVAAFSWIALIGITLIYLAVLVFGFGRGIHAKSKRTKD